MNKEKSKKISKSQFTILEEMKNINIPYDSLKPLEPEIDTVLMFQKFKEILSDKNTDWTLLIGVINYLRRVNKYDKTIFGQFFYGAKIYPKLLDLINSVRSSVSKNVLLLLNEIFSENISENKNSILGLIKATLPILIQKINSNQSFIKVECNQLLDSLSKNVKFPEMLLIILQQMNSSPKVISTPNIRNKQKENEILADFFEKNAKNLGKNILMENPQNQEIIKSLVSFYHLNKNNNVKFCKKIIKCLVEIIGKENFDVIMEKCSKKDKEGIISIENEKEEDNKKMRATVSSTHFRKNIKERKKSMMLSKCHYTSLDKGNKSVSIKFEVKRKEATVSNKNNNLIKLHNNENVQKNN